MELPFVQKVMFLTLSVAIPLRMNVPACMSVAAFEKVSAVKRISDDAAGVEANPFIKQHNLGSEIVKVIFEPLHRIEARCLWLPRFDCSKCHFITALVALILNL